MSEQAGIVYNYCYGGFSLSDAAFERYLELKGIAFEKEEANRCVHYWKAGCARDNDAYLYDRDIPRNDPILVKVVEEMGEAANGDYAKLGVRYLPKGTLFRIDEYDGMETVATKDSYGWDVA